VTRWREERARGADNATAVTTAMETAGRTLEEEEVSQAMRECGLGTPATRAAILETLLRREYVVREGKAIQATDKGIALIGRVHAHVKSPAMTGEWEAKLGRIERGLEARGADFAALRARRAPHGRCTACGDPISARTTAAPQDALGK